MDGKQQPTGRPAMARRPPQPGSGDEQLPGKSEREKIIDAFMALLAERPIEQIGFGDLAARSGVALTDCRKEFGSVVGVLAAHMKEIDRRVLSGREADMAEEPPRERLFDVLMRRLELLAPHRAAIRSLVRSACRNPGLALALNAMATRSQQWMLTAADISAAGPKGMVRAQGLALLYGRVFRTFFDDDDPGLARTMAALDRELARGQRWSGFLDDLCRLAPPVCCPRGRGARKRRDDGPDEAPVAAGMSV
jgi:AcrR family transcriptional regulator